MMKHKCVVVLIGVLILPSLVSCGPRVALTPGDAGAILPPAPTTRPATVGQPTDPPQGSAISIRPTQIITEDKVMSGTPVQPAFGGESTESVKLARQDLARRLGVSVDSITVAAVIGQEFSLHAFDCRTAKERISREDSPQVLSGLSILLRGSGRRYEYHASCQTVLFCRPLP
jgi:hypothetical protein